MYYLIIAVRLVMVMVMGGGGGGGYYLDRGGLGISSCSYNRWLKQKKSLADVFVNSYGLGKTVSELPV